MDRRIFNKEKTTEKIYSRNRVKFPKIEKENMILNRFNNDKTRKIVKIVVVLLIAFMVVDYVIKTVEPIIDIQCSSMAKSIATKISNEQATNVMKDYKYDDFVNIDKTEHINAFRSQITVLPGVLECHHLAGAYDYLLKVSVSDTDALESFLTNKLKKITGVSSSNTFITLATLKEELNC